MGVKAVVHGDDFTSLGKMMDVQWLHESLQKEWSCTIRGILGPPGFPGTTSSIVILNRIVTWHENGISWEPDPRHADTIVKTLLPTSGKRNITTPCIRVKIAECPEDEEHDHLPHEEAKVFKSLAMRANYLGQDRPDLQFACRELAKGMSQPQSHHWTALKRLARYLEYKPRLVQEFKNQDKIFEVSAWCDADHAGCLRTRKSTSGGVLMLGENCVKTYSRGQGVISLSSGESEYYALVSAISEALGLNALMKDFGVRLKVGARMDATAGIAMGSRRGLGKAKHIDTVFHWVQSYVSEGKVKLFKRHTSEMLADMLTKPVSEALANKFLKEMNFVFKEGKHELAPEV